MTTKAITDSLNVPPWDRIKLECFADIFPCYPIDFEKRKSLIRSRPEKFREINNILFNNFLKTPYSMEVFEIITGLDSLLKPDAVLK